MPTYRRGRKVGSVKTRSADKMNQGDKTTGDKKDRIAPAQWKEENSSRCHRFEICHLLKNYLIKN